MQIPLHKRWGASKDTKQVSTCWQLKVGIVLEQLLPDGSQSLSLSLFLTRQQQPLSLELSPLLCLLFFPSLFVLFPLLGFFFGPACCLLFLQRPGIKFLPWAFTLFCQALKQAMFNVYEDSVMLRWDRKANSLHRHGSTSY